MKEDVSNMVSLIKVSSPVPGNIVEIPEFVGFINECAFSGITETLKVKRNKVNI